jgi:hypothetical protein
MVKLTATGRASSSLARKNEIQMKNTIRKRYTYRDGDEFIASIVADAVLGVDKISES